MPHVSVVIPTHNRRTLVTEAVASVLAQTHRELELVVVDDGSSDETAGHLRREVRDERLKVLTQENRGVSAARNRGVRETSGEWVGFLDSDDLWLPLKLQRQLEELADHPEIPAVYTEEVWYRDGRWANPRKVHEKHSGRIFRHCLPLCIISPSSVLLRRSVFEELGGFDETLPVCEDYDLWLRLTARHPVRLVRERLIVKRNGHGPQLSQDHWAQDRFRVRALWKLALDPSIPSPLRSEALETAARKSRIVAEGARKRGALSRAEVFDHSEREARCRIARGRT